MPDFGDGKVLEDSNSSFSVPEDEFLVEDPDFLSAVHAGRPVVPRQNSHAPSLLSKSLAPSRGQPEAKTAGVSPCFAFVRFGVSENRSCNFSHDPSLARVAWKCLADQLMSSPYAEKPYKPKVPNVPTILPSKLAHVGNELEDDRLDKVLADDAPVRYFVKPGASFFGLGSMVQELVSGEVTKTLPQSSASSRAIDDY